MSSTPDGQQPYYPQMPTQPAPAAPSYSTPMPPSYGAPTPPPYGAPMAPDPTYGQPYGAPMPPYQAGMPYAAQPTRNMFVFVMSILAVISGGGNLIGGFALFGMTNTYRILGISSGFPVMLGFISLLYGAAALYGGIMGIRNASNPHAMTPVMGAAGAMIALIVIMIIVDVVSIGFAGQSILSFAIPVLLLIAAMQFKNKA